MSGLRKCKQQNSNCASTKILKTSNQNKVHRQQRTFLELSSTFANTTNISQKTGNTLARGLNVEKSFKKIPKVINRLEKNIQTLKKYCTEISKQKNNKNANKSNNKSKTKLMPHKKSVCNTEKQIFNKNVGFAVGEAEVDNIKQSYAHTFGKQTNNLIQLYNYYKSYMQKSNESISLSQSHNSMSITQKQTKSEGSKTKLIYNTMNIKQEHTERIQKQISSKIKQQIRNNINTKEHIAASQNLVKKKLSKLQIETGGNIVLYKQDQKTKKQMKFTGNEVQNINLNHKQTKKQITTQQCDAKEKLKTQKVQQKYCKKQIERLPNQFQSKENKQALEKQKISKKEEINKNISEQKVNKLIKLAKPNSTEKISNQNDSLFEQIFKKNMYVNKIKQEINGKLKKQQKKIIDCIEENTALDEAVLIEKYPNEQQNMNFIKEELPLSKQDISLLDKLVTINNMISTNELNLPRTKQNLLVQGLRIVNKKKGFTKSKFYVDEIPKQKKNKQPQIIELANLSPEALKADKQKQQNSLQGCDISLTQECKQDSFLRNIQDIQLDL